MTKVNNLRVNAKFNEMSSKVDIELVDGTRNLKKKYELTDGDIKKLEFFIGTVVSKYLTSKEEKSDV